MKRLVWTRYLASARLKFLEMNSTWTGLFSAELHRSFHRSWNIFYQPFQLKAFITKTTVLNHLQSNSSSLDIKQSWTILLCLPNFGRGTFRLPTTTSILLSCLLCPFKNPKRTWLTHAPFPCFPRDVEVKFLQYYKPCLDLRKF